MIWKLGLIFLWNPFLDIYGQNQTKKMENNGILENLFGKNNFYDISEKT